MIELFVAIALSRVDNAEILPVLKCESGLEHYSTDGSVKRGRSGEVGISQFMPATWDWMNKLRKTDLDIQNPMAQINMTDWAFSNGYKHLWTCYNQIHARSI